MAGQRVASVWLRQERGERGPAPAHSRAEIAAAAIAIADAADLAAVSMRRVAAAVGAGAATLYRYVDNRDQLLELMIDTAIGELDLSAPNTQDWRVDLGALAKEIRALYRSHHWMLDVPLGTVSLGPNAVDLLELGLRLLRDVPASPNAKMEAMAMLNGFVGLAVRAEIAMGGSTAAWQAAQTEFLASVVADGRHPHLTAAFTDRSAATAPPGEDYLLERVLPRMLSGLFLA